jgi:UDP-2,3-diacylglucosamine pyrophosphatase LpxH
VHAATDLARLLTSRPGHELVLAGDAFDLSLDPADRDPAESVTSLLTRHRTLVGALRAHLARGGRVTLIGGNHDAAATGDSVRQRLLAELELTQQAALTATPWFLRRGRVHIEHGHLYDPDNAPTHPLAAWSSQTEPLGIALTRRFLGPTGALQFSHAHQTTPLAGLLRAFRLYGPRAPALVMRYFQTAIALCAEAGRSQELERERERGAAGVADFATSTGLQADVVQRLSELAAPPTHHDFADTFMRLYFDRVIATLLLGSAGALGVATGSLAAAAVAAGSVAYLSMNVLGGGSRYSGRVEERLRQAALAIGELSGSELVIFGHTHREDRAPGYLNSGSFAYPGAAERPYLVVDPAGSAELRRLSPA